MKYAITISDLTDDERRKISAFLDSMGAQSATPANGKGRQAVAELAAATGATIAQQQPAAPPVADPFAGQTPPPPPPPPAAPAQPQAPAMPGVPMQSPPAAGAEIDSKGIPHNPEFHAETKRKNNDGSWAKRKGVNKEACAAWEASLAGRTPTAPTTPTTDQINAMHGAPGQPNGHTVVTDPFAGQTVISAPPSDPFAAPAPTAPVAPPAPPAPAPAAEPVSYGQWYTLYSNLLAAGKMTPETYTEIAGRYGAVEDVMKFQRDDAARANCFAEFQALAAA